MLCIPLAIGSISFQTEAADFDPGTGEEEVTVDLNGGVGGTWTWNLLINYDYNVLHYNDIPTDVPVRDGYKFLGWSMADDGTSDFQPGDFISPTDHMRFVQQYFIYAVWEEVATNPDLEFLSDPIADGTITYLN